MRNDATTYRRRRGCTGRGGQRSQRNVTLDSDRLGGVGTCVKEKLGTITVSPFEGDGTMHVTLSPPARNTKKVPRAF